MDDAIPSEHLLDCLCRLDLDLRITYASPAALSMFGIPAEALVGTLLADHCPPEDVALAREILNQALARTDRTVGFLYPLHVRHADGRLVPIEVHSRLVLDRAGQPVAVVGVIRDITVREAADREQRAREARRLEVQKMAAVAQLAGGVVGDLAALLRALSDHPATAAHPALAPLREQAARRIAQLRTLAGQQDLQRRDLDVDAMVGGLVEALRPTLPAGIVLTHQPRAARAPIWADPAQLGDVLHSLILNARDAMPHGGLITVATGVRAAGVRRDGPFANAPRLWVTIEVRDTGQGFDAAIRERILEPFFTTKNDKSSAGLGLALAHGVVDQHGGRLEVESEVGRGSTFRVVLPVQYADEVATGRNEVDLGARTVLLVDDDPEIRSYCGKILRSAGFTVQACEDAVEALAFIAGPDPVDLVVLDWALPGLEGRRVREQLTRRLPNVPIVVISGYEREEFAALGGIDRETPWLVKPFTPAALLAAVRRLLPAQAGES